VRLWGHNPANFYQHGAIFAITRQKLQGHLPATALGRAFPKVLLRLAQVRKPFPQVL
jgi:hypothetical protein